MRLLISFVLSFLLIFATLGIANAATESESVTTVTTVSKTVVKAKHHKHHRYCQCYKHKKHHRTNYRVRTYYSPSYCIGTSCGLVCEPESYARCKTEYHYRSGRNSGRVEVCY